MVSTALGICDRLPLILNLKDLIYTKPSCKFQSCSLSIKKWHVVLNVVAKVTFDIFFSHADRRHQTNNKNWIYPLLFNFATCSSQTFKAQLSWKQLKMQCETNPSFHSKTWPTCVRLDIITIPRLIQLYYSPIFASSKLTYLW